MSSGSSTGGNSLYVGSLDPRVCTELLQEVFSLAGKVTLCRVVADKATGASMRFGFVDYEDHATATRALEMFNGRSIYGSALTVDWAHAGAGAAAGRPASGADDIANHYCLFIGNLSSDVTDEQLREAFSQFGICSSAKCAKDPGSGKNQGYAFVSFKERSAAEAAIEGLDGQMLNNRPLRVDWAKTKTNAATRAAALGLPEVSAPGTGGGPDSTGSGNTTGRRPSLTLDAIRNQTPIGNITAYVAGLPATITDTELRDAFAQYGQIHEIRIPESVKSQGGDKLYAFVRYVDHESAARAIFECQENKEVAGRVVTVHWGRESVRRTPMQGPGGRPPMRMSMGGHSPMPYGNVYGHQYAYAQRPPYQQPYARGPPPGPIRHTPHSGVHHHRHRPY